MALCSQSVRVHPPYTTAELTVLLTLIRLLRQGSANKSGLHLKNDARQPFSHTQSMFKLASVCLRACYNDIACHGAPKSAQASNICDRTQIAISAPDAGATCSRSVPTTRGRVIEFCRHVSGRECRFRWYPVSPNLTANAPSTSLLQ